MRYNLSILSLSVIGILLFNSCDLMKDLKYDVNPNPLTLKGDSVQFSVDVQVPEKGLNKKVKADITAKIGSQQIGIWTIQGEKVTGNGQQINFKPGGTATFEMTLPYEDYMMASDLTISAKVYKGKKEKAKEAIPETKIADATIITQKLVKNIFEVMSIEDGFKRSVNKTIAAQINFNKGKYDVKSSELVDKDIKELINWVKSNMDNPRIVLNSIEIKGYASPDGEENKNSSLSDSRAYSARKAIMSLFKRKRIKFYADTNNYSVNSFGEDFDGFRDQLAITKTISDSDKELFLRILKMQSDPAKREKEMINLGKSYDALEKDVFPAIRRSNILLNYTEQGHTDEELLQLAANSPDSLTEDEILFTAEKLMKNINDQTTLLEAGVKKYTSSVRLLNNYAVKLFLSGKTSESASLLAKAIGMGENSSVLNNMAAIRILEGKKLEARELLEKAKGGLSEEQKKSWSYNAAILDVMDGDYKSAERGFVKNSFNKALNAVLMEKLDEAMEIVGSIDADENVHYLTAIISAKKGLGVDEIVASLNKAFAIDSALKSKAATDREFVKYFSESTFKNAVN